MVKNRTTFVVVIAATLTLAITGTASAASTITAEKAFLKAQACLKAHGARSVLNSGLVGGDVTFPAKGSASWTYRVTKAYPLNKGTVLGVSFTFSRMPAGTRLVVRRCVLASTH